MIKTQAKILIIVIGAAVVFGLYYKFDMTKGPTETPTPTPSTTQQQDMLHLNSPKENDMVANPLHIEGEARGNWYFEASFPIKIYDANNNLLGSTIGQAQSDWMTTEFVPFRAELLFKNPTTETGTLVLEKDNPSGMAENADEKRIPIKFDLSETPKQKIKLYYYNPANDEGTEGLKCSSSGLVAVERQIPVTETPVKDSVTLLLRGAISSEERTSGITTDFPLPGFEFVGASLKSGVVTIEFADPQNKTVGGACRVNVLKLQIEATAKQFNGVKSVQFKPDTLFQP